MTSTVFRSERLTPEAFEALASAHSDVVISLEQTPQWAEFERRLGREPYGLWAYYDDGGAPVAVMSLLRVRRRFRESLVAVNGPAWIAERTPEAELRLMRTVQQQFSTDTDANPLYVRMQVKHAQPPADGPIEHGWYERELVVDLTPSEQAIFKSFRPNARNSIRRAERSGVEIRVIDRSDWVRVFQDELYPILQETAERDGFSSFSPEYYQELLTSLGDYLRVMVAYSQGRAVSWLITTEYRGYSVYYFAGSTHDARKTFAPYLLLWEAFKLLKANGNTACGLTGIVSENYPQLQNVTTFKRNFSKNVVHVPTTYDVPLDPRKYRLVFGALTARRALSNKGRGLLMGAASSLSKLRARRSGGGS
ncbi:hypothetical protein BJ994_003246 [Arthrobacter pigmenti]|uniref:BioF2-like acetyltransferase domain-containing protein n=1 Tax=Arthrobacter pigmenti TaxID=271432 RepID=A0A846RRI9_9MICC|nr:hypothetical protein [Arthrobacter pigmenti]